MIQIFSLFFLRELKEVYPTRWAVVMELGLLYLSLLIYSYTAQAFGSSMENSYAAVGSNYFTYVVIGEVGLMIPAILFESPLRVIRTAISEETFDHFIVSPRGVMTPLFIQSVTHLPRELFRTCATFFCAYFFFSLQLSWDKLATVLLWIGMACPLFLGMGLIAGSLFIYFGRGVASFSYLSTLSMVLAGAYFPVTVFPGWVQKVITWVFPFTILLQGIRQSLHSSWKDPQFYLRLGALGVCGFVFLIFSSFLFNYSIRLAMKQGKPWSLSIRN